MLIDTSGGARVFEKSCGPRCRNLKQPQISIHTWRKVSEQHSQTAQTSFEKLNVDKNAKKGVIQQQRNVCLKKLNNLLLLFTVSINLFVVNVACYFCNISFILKIKFYPDKSIIIFFSIAKECNTNVKRICRIYIFKDKFRGGGSGVHKGEGCSKCNALVALSYRGCQRD